MNIDHTVADNSVITHFTNRGITWRYIAGSSAGCNGASEWRITVLASIGNNDTMMHCVFDNSDCHEMTHTAQLIVVTGKLSQPTTADTIAIATPGPPGPPVAPSVTVTNLTALTLTWTAPWPFPVINYTVTMLNLTSNQITQWTTCDEQLVLRGGGGQCDELVFTVEAETDVGSTGPSTNTTSGFPKGTQTHDNSF